MYPHQFIIEGLDRLGKDTLIDNIQHHLGYHLVLHYKRPQQLDYYMPDSALRKYQEASFRTMFQLLRGAPEAKVICNRAHLGECVYAPYRNYEGEYVFAIEHEYRAILKASKAAAALKGRDFVIPDDVIEMAPHVLRHRIMLTPEKEMEGLTPDELITSIIKAIEVPR